jgi:hypothetical protein
MANINATVAQYFIPEIWANRGLELLRNQVVLAKLVSKDSDVDAFTVGKTLHIPYAGTMTANNKAADTAVTLQTPSGGTEVQVLLNKHKEVSFIIEDAAVAQSNQNLMDTYIEAGIIAIAEAIESDLTGLYAGFTTTPIGVGGTDITLATVRSARKALNDQKAPQARRSLVLSSKDEISLLGDSNAQSYFAFAQQQAVQEGSIGRLYGFDVYMSQLVAFSTNFKNLAFVPTAIMLAMRGLPAPPANSGAVSTTVKDPISGLVLRVTMAYNASFLGTQVTIDCLYGVKVLQAAKGIQVLS